MEKATTVHLSKIIEKQRSMRPSDFLTAMAQKGYRIAWNVQEGDIVVVQSRGYLRTAQVRNVTSKRVYTEYVTTDQIDRYGQRPFVTRKVFQRGEVYLYTRIHRFEAAGLGKAPFRCVGFFSSRGPLRLKDGSMVGSPGQPMGTCDYCGTGIADCFSIKSADGKRFIVGSDCVAKTGDTCLEKQLKSTPEFRSHQRKVRDARHKRKMREAMREIVDNVDVLEQIPHPRLFNDKKTGRPLTMLDYVVWYFDNAGAAGREEAWKVAKAALTH